MLFQNKSFEVCSNRTLRKTVRKGQRLLKGFLCALMQACHCIATPTAWTPPQWLSRITAELQLWSKSAANTVAECDPTERQGSSIGEAACRTLVTVCDKFKLVRCSQSVASYGWEKVCFEVCRKSWITNNASTRNFDSNCKGMTKKHMKC